MGSKLGDKNNRHDQFYKQAQKENYASRAVYKLQEMDQKFKLLRKGMAVLDLGAAPGSWSQYAAKAIGSKGVLIAVDLSPIKLGFPSWVRTIEEDMFKLDFDALLEQTGRPFNLIMSDMASNTTGIRFTDAVRSAALVNAIMDILPMALAPNGKFVAKIFRGQDFDATLHRLRHLFKRVKTFKPKSSRTESKEQYFVAWESKMELKSR